MDDDGRLRVLDLFSGIGGFSLGLERAGMTTVGFCEIDPFCRAVLKKHWPEVPCHDDITTREFVAGEADIVCGGFPCQGISSANHRGEGLADARSGLWSEIARAIRTVRPRYGIFENVAALTFRGLDEVLWDIARCGYDAEWSTLPASACGAPHSRDRIFIVAYPAGERREEDEIFRRVALKTAGQKQAMRLRGWPGKREHSAALPNRIRWVPDSELCRVADGVPDELDRYRALGNSIVPQCVELIGRAIMEVEQCTTTT